GWGGADEREDFIRRPSLQRHGADHQPPPPGGRHDPCPGHVPRRRPGVSDCGQQSGQAALHAGRRKRAGVRGAVAHGERAAGLRRGRGLGRPMRREQFQRRHQSGHVFQLTVFHALERGSRSLDPDQRRRQRNPRGQLQPRGRPDPELLRRTEYRLAIARHLRLTPGLRPRDRELDRLHHRCVGLRRQLEHCLGRRERLSGHLSLLMRRVPVILRRQVMLRNRILLVASALVCGLIAATGARADVLISEDFNSATTANPWYFFNGACLTASTTVAGSNPGTPPGCTADTYYTEHLVGGYNGRSGTAQTLPDPSGNGALRFTNGCIPDSSGNCGSGGKAQNGAIISANTYSTSGGLDITFKTLTYRGDSGGSGNDGADGMSFFLMDGAIATTAELAADPADAIGSWGGSLGYTCSNANSDYHGMVGAWLGLGIDEFGNFLNGTNDTLNENSPYGDAGDNTASGGGYMPNRIGLRGRGSIAYTWLSANYPTD